MLLYVLCYFTCCPNTPPTFTTGARETPIRYRVLAVSSLERIVLHRMENGYHAEIFLNGLT